MSKLDIHTAPENKAYERVLLLLTAAFLLVNFLALGLLRGLNLAHWTHWFVWIGCALGGHLLLNRFLPRRDALLFPLVMLLSGWGMLLIDRLLPTFADRQTMWLLIGVIALLTTAIFPQVLRWLRTYRYTLLLVGLGLLVSTIILGQNPSGFGPELWLGFVTDFASIFFQPSELLKLILVAFLASYLSEQYPILRTGDASVPPQNQWLSPRILGPIVLMWGLCMVMLIWQRDLGTALLFFAVFITLLYVATGQLLIIASGIILVIIATIAGYLIIDLVRLRVDIWLNPWLTADSNAYQIVQSLMAFGAGGIFGSGIGQGSSSFIPVVHSDFIFAALAEEWGLLGVIVVIVSLAVIIMRGMRIAVLNQERSFYALLAVGFSLLIGLQSLLIMAGVLKLLPLTGVTLPFMSYGGSSLVVSFTIAGLLLRLSSEG